MDALSDARERLDRGDYAGARDAAERALSDAEQADDLGAKVNALTLLGEALLGLGDPFGAREALEAVYLLAWAPEAPWDGSAPIMQDTLAEARARTGDWEGVDELLREAEMMLMEEDWDLDEHEAICERVRVLRG